MGYLVYAYTSGETKRNLTYVHSRIIIACVRSLLTSWSSLSVSVKGRLFAIVLCERDHLGDYSHIYIIFTPLILSASERVLVDQV